MTAILLSLEQRLCLYRDGYVVLPGIVPEPLVRAARRLLNLDLGRVWMRAAALRDPADTGRAEKVRRAVDATGATQAEPAILDLFNATPIKPMLEHALGAALPEARGAQLATLFPMAPSDYVNESGYRDRDTPFFAWHGHLDGLWNGATAMHQRTDAPISADALAAWSQSPSRNRQSREYPAFGTNIANFTALVGVALSDQREPGAGNLGVLAGAHHAMTEFFCHQRDAGGPLGPDGPDWPRVDTDAPNSCGLRHYPEAVRAAFADGAARTADGKLWPKPTLLCLAPGDAVVALHTLPHCGTRVAGPDPRLMAYFRVTSGARPTGNRAVYPDALCDPWIEWPVIRATVQQMHATR